MTGNSHLFKNVAWISIGQLASKALRAIFVLLAARIVGVSEYGIATYILAQLGIFTVLADCGTSQLVTRECARGAAEKQEYYLRTGFAMKLILICIMLVLLFISMKASHGAISISDTAIALTLVIFVCDSLKDLSSGVMIAREKNKSEAIINLSTSLLLVLVGIPLMYLEKTSTRLLAVYASASVLAIMLESIVFYKIGLIKRGKVFFKDIIDLLKVSYIFGLQNGLMTIIFAFDSIIIGLFLDNHALGIYGAALKLPLLLNMVPGFISLGFLPELTRSAHENPSHFSKVLSKAVTFIMLVGIPIVIGGEMVADRLILSLFGAEYAGAPTIFRILLGMNLFAFFSGIFTIALYAYDQQKKVVRTTAIGAFISIVGNLLLIPVWGIVGSAITSVIVQGVIMMLLIINIRSLAAVKLYFDGTWMRFSIGLGAMIVTCLSLLTLTIHVAVVIAASMVVYGAILYPSVKKLITN